MSDSPPPLAPHAALFLDVDGTLLDITETPHETRVDADLKRLLETLARRLGGALALVSGRSLAQLDALFAPLALPAAGMHGVERRSAAGPVRHVAAPDRKLDPARAALARFVTQNPGALLEDKGASLALHYRRAPALEAQVRATVRAAQSGLGTEFEIQEGKKVVELKPAGFSKAAAIAEFLGEPPFAGRVPVMAGDDLTDQGALRAVETAGGMSIAVGGRIDGQWTLADPRALRAWLARSLAALPPDRKPRGSV